MQSYGEIVECMYVPPVADLCQFFQCQFFQFRTYYYLYLFVRGVSPVVVTYALQPIIASEAKQ
jgi:hypothetical protein